MSETLNPEAVFLADQLERSIRGGAWHGPAVEEALEGIEPELAARQPAHSKNSILSIAEHVAFWIETADARLSGKRRRGPEDWVPSEGTPQERLTAVRERIRNGARTLQESVRQLDAAGLDKPVSGSDPVARGLIFGVLQHNAFHTAQIVQLARELKHGAQ